VPWCQQAGSRSGGNSEERGDQNVGANRGGEGPTNPSIAQAWIAEVEGEIRDAGSRRRGDAKARHAAEPVQQLRLERLLQEADSAALDLEHAHDRVRDDSEHEWRDVRPPAGPIRVRARVRWSPRRASIS
jgi:hypothetical protein